MHSKKYVIARFHFEDYFETDIIEKVDTAELPKLGECSIIVYGDEGDRLPHFHLVNFNKNPKQSIDCCICINEPRYFIHGNHRGTLTDAQALALEKVMTSKSKIFPERSVWGVTRGLWSIANSDKMLYRKRVPRYRDLNRYTPI